MAIKDILVHLDSDDAGAVVVDAAVKMAKAHDARLIGLYAGVPFDIPSYVVAQLPPEVIETHQKHVQESARSTADAFEKACADNDISYDIRTGDWRDPVESIICTHARYADMVMIVQPENEILSGRAREVADHVVLRSGAPVVIVPRKPARTGAGARILIGWDGRRHAARAVKDAMPILAAAESVKILAVDPKPGVAGLGDLPGADLAQYLATHGVKAEADHKASGSLRVGDVLLNEAAEIGADLIVTGAYGHARLGELILGGVTDTLMEEMTIPVLMSH